MGRPKAGVVKTGKGDVETIRVNPDDLQNEGLFDSQSLDANANVPLLDLLSAMNADSADGTVTVSKITIKPGGARVEEWLFSGQPSGDLLNDLQADYGPGTYSIKVYSRDADGVKAIRANKSITIGSPPASKIKTEVVTVQPQQDRFAEFMAQQAAASAQREVAMFNLIQAIATNQNKGGGDQLSGFKTFAESVGLMQKNSPVAPGPLDMLAALQSMLKMVKDLTPGGDAGALPVNENGDIGPNALLAQGMQMFAKILELAKGQQAQPVALEAPPHSQSVVAPPVHTAPPVQTAAVNQPPRPGNGAPPPAADDDLSPEESDAMMMQLFMKKLISAARRNDDVTGYAEQLEPLVNDDAVEAIRGAEWFAALCAIAPDAAAYQAWFARLRDKLIALLDETDGVDIGDSSRPATPPAAVN